MGRPAQVIDELWIDESPCELCSYASQCRTRLEACEAFATFARSGGRRWRSQPRIPSQRIYEEVFQADAPG
jgi:hypothetical protein